MRYACFMLHDVYSDLMSNEQKYECDEVSVMLRSICIMSLLSFSLKLLLLSGLIGSLVAIPCVYQFLQCLKNEQNITDVKMTKLMMRESPEPLSAKWRKYDEKLQTIIQKFDSYPTILDFLKCTSCLM